VVGWKAVQKTQNRASGVPGRDVDDALILGPAGSAEAGRDAAAAAHPQGSIDPSVADLAADAAIGTTARLAVAAAPLGLHEQCDQISAFAGVLKLSSPTAVPVNPAPDARRLREVFATCRNSRRIRRYGRTTGRHLVATRAKLGICGWALPLPHL
jgi:hypothetical protein